MAEGRYAGLTYASIGADRGAGGWQVHGRSPGLSSGEEALLADRVVTAFESHLGPLPQFVEPEVLATLPIRFSAEPVADGIVIRHAVQAGADATGRPGNVFTTVLLDREAGSPPLPIRLWRSPDLHAPFGAAEVTTAVPRWDVRAGTDVDAAAVAAVVTDPDRWTLLTVLLDAVAGAVAGGPTVVLRARDQDDAALWIGAVCLLTAPAWSARLHWSLYERAEAVDALRRHGAHLVVLPVDDDPGSTEGVVVLDVDERPALGVLGGTDHVTARGRRVPVTAWSDLVTELFPLETADVVELLHGVDGAAGRATGAGEPAWWLAAGLLGSAAGPPDLVAAASETLRRTPAPAGLAEQHLAVLDGALAAGPAAPEELFDALADVDPDDARFGPLAERYARTALTDLGWLDSAGSGAPATGQTAHVDRDEVAGALRSLLADADGAILLRRLANVLDLLDFVALLDASDPRIDEPLAELVLMAAAEVDPEHAPDLVRSVNRLPAHLRSEVLPMVAAGPLGGFDASDAARVDLPAGLRQEQVLQLLEAGDGALLGIAAADAMLARGPERAVARRLGVVAAARSGDIRDIRRSLHLDDWDVGDRLAAAAEQPALLTDDQLLTAIATGTTEQVGLLVGVEDVTEAVMAALHLRLQAEDALADEHWRGDLSDGVVLKAADQLAGGSSASTATLLTPRLRLLPVISLLMTRLSAPPADSAFEVLLRRQAVGRRLEPLPADAVTLLAGRLRDPVQLPLALAYAASDRSSPSEDSLRRGLLSEEGDLLDAAVADVLPQFDADRYAAIVAEAEAVLADGSEASRLDRLLQRRASPVADYLEDHGLALPRKVR